MRLTRIATPNELDFGKAATAMPIFYGGGRVAATIESPSEYGQRIEAGRRRANRCVPQFLAPTGPITSNPRWTSTTIYLNVRRSTPNTVLVQRFQGSSRLLHRMSF